MLEAYLAFARGDAGEASAPTDMAEFLEELRPTPSATAIAPTSSSTAPDRLVRPGGVQALPRQPGLQRRAPCELASRSPAIAITAI